MGRDRPTKGVSWGSLRKQAVGYPLSKAFLSREGPAYSSGHPHKTGDNFLRRLLTDLGRPTLFHALGPENQCMKYLLWFNIPLALIVFFKEKPLKFSHLCFKYKNVTFTKSMCFYFSLRKESKVYRLADGQRIGTSQCFWSIYHARLALPRVLVTE